MRFHWKKGPVSIPNFAVGHLNLWTPRMRRVSSFELKSNWKRPGFIDMKFPIGRNRVSPVSIIFDIGGAWSIWGWAQALNRMCQRAALEMCPVSISIPNNWKGGSCQLSQESVYPGFSKKKSESYLGYACSKGCLLIGFKEFLTTKPGRPLSIICLKKAISFTQAHGYS